ncbi:acetate/propionate family kinase [Paracoccus liaowanqingii]|uniref:Acetate kinase n=1 Tax=Paracoccus liaowanqingii TaxID=2560053 RepID=A0A4P7HL39_9RHOB|nr:acetate/propionate family kinase [Paracoccus liaowanqingii]QBX34929.1 acetate/propionate family kinase [Paracoccus liaowanqingii]
MRVLVFNAGSSSLKFGLFDGDRQVFKGSFDRFREGGCDVAFEGADGPPEQGRAPHADLAAAIAAVPGVLAERGLAGIDAVGHRLAHGGTEFTGPAKIDEAVIARIEALTPLAPLHNPAMLEGLRLASHIWPDVPQVAVFDTSFHLTNPARATTYAVPAAWRDAGLRRFGFHGTSHKYVAQRAAEALGQPLSDLRIISVHLGNGASACAVQYGASIDSSMGMTPLEGLVMGTRSGDIDPGAFGFLQRHLGLDVAAIEAALYSDSGLKGLTGSPDMRDVEDRAAAGDAAAQLAINLYAYRVRKYLGGYAAAMGGVDAVVFTGGIGQNSASMRRRICDGLSFMGLMLDDDRNRAPDLSDRAAPQIQAQGSRVAVVVTETAEQLMIAHEVRTLLDRPALTPRPVPVAVSGRHVHLSAETVRALFGADYRLTEGAPLRQPGNWVAEERVTLEGPKGRLERVAILGPLRPRTQIEVSRTDSFALGIDAPVRNSGQLEGTPKVRLIGPQGAFETDGLIVAARHVHTNPTDAAAMGLSDGEMVEIEVQGADGRGLVFAHTLVRVAAGTVTEMHIDTDEANAAGISGHVDGAVVPHVQALPKG